MKYKNYKNKMPNVKARLHIIALLVIILTVSIYFFVIKKDNSTIDSESTTTSDAQSAQADFNINDHGNDDGGRQAGNSLREDKGSAGATDNSGNIDQSVDTSNPISSSTGEISLYSPKQNSMISNQITVAGTSTLDSVMYRISDNVSGLITTGSLKIVDGRFSGIINIDTNGDIGQLDIYSTRSDGNEFSNISVSLSFN